MFIFTAKVSRKKLILGAVGALILIGAAIFTASALRARGTAALSPGGEATGIKTNADRVAYLERYGWKVVAEPLSVEELVIPKEFDETYTQYIALQTSQGFELSKYCGKRVKRYGYTITNYPTGEAGVQAGILLYKDRVVGGEVLSPQMNGFIHSLEMPS